MRGREREMVGWAYLQSLDVDPDWDQSGSLLIFPRTTSQPFTLLFISPTSLTMLDLAFWYEKSVFRGELSNMDDTRNANVMLDLDHPARILLTKGHMRKPRLQASKDIDRAHDWSRISIEYTFVHVWCLGSSPMTIEDSLLCDHTLNATSKIRDAIKLCRGKSRSWSKLVTWFCLARTSRQIEDLRLIASSVLICYYWKQKDTASQSFIHQHLIIPASEPWINCLEELR